jgi:hypothetical protein
LENIIVKAPQTDFYSIIQQATELGKLCWLWLPLKAWKPEPQAWVLQGRLQAA